MQCVMRCVLHSVSCVVWYAYRELSKVSGVNELTQGRPSAPNSEIGSWDLQIKYEV
jgi:hypothetical protein